MPHELANKPLVEAILELKWSPQGQVIAWSDPAYPLYVGTLYEAIKDDYGVVEELPAKQIPDEISAGVVKYRFRRSADGWPLVQAGPGIATLNFTEAYDWERFRKAALDFFPRLLSAYRFSGTYQGPAFTAAILRYINAAEADPALEDPLRFMHTKLHTEIGLPADIVQANQIRGAAAAVDLRLSYPLADPVGSGNIRLTTGKKNDKPAIVWDLSVISQGADAPQSEEQMEQWLLRAHDLIEAWFFTFIEGELEAQFGGQRSANPA